MPHVRLVVLSILVFVVVSSSTAAAQTIPSSYTFIEHSREWTVFAGKSDINPGQLGLGPRNASVFGGRYAAAFGGAMGLDISATVFSSRRDILDVSKPVDDRIIGRSEMAVGLLDLRLRLNLTGQRAWCGLQPFISFGGGVAAGVSTPRAVEISTELVADQWYSFSTRFAATFGGGANYHVSDKISLRVDGVMNLWKIVTPVGWLTVDANPEGETPEGEWVSAKSIMLGASWRF